MKTLAILIPAALALTACDKSDHGADGTNITISGDNGSAGITNGTASIDVPGFKGELKLPKIQLDAGDMDINGAKLFPGSTVSNVSVNAKDGADEGKVRIAFSAPAGIAAVRDHFRTELTKADFKVADSGNGLSGTTDDGKPFALTLNADGADKTAGELTLGK